MLSRKLAGALGAGVAALGIAAAATPAHAATFTVNNADSGGAGSLRSAIAAAEATQRRDEIVFEIPGTGVHTITPTNPLPAISRPLTIRGYSQPGADPATEDASASPTIVINAVNVSRGLDIGGDEIEVRGLVVKNAQQDGIAVDGRDNVIAGNHIGTNAAGDAARGNGGFGVSVAGGDNVIGGPDPKDRNVIADNSAGQVHLEDGSGHVVEGNRVGTDAAGKHRLGGIVGVLLRSSGNTVRDNQLSGLTEGALILGDDNTLQGNDVGTTASGKRKLPNLFGIRILGGDDNRIGGSGAGEGNLVSGNRVQAIGIVPGSDTTAGNHVEGNLIGTTFTGRAPLPNGTSGGAPAVVLNGVSGNTIGGEAPGAGNVISANAGDGVLLQDADDTRVLGNRIGTNKTGRRELGNGGSGVRILGGQHNSVGEEDETSPINVIAHNDEDGVEVESGSGNAIVRNSMFDNGNLGIDLGADGATANDPSDLDGGANGLQNGPEIDEVTRTTVEWDLETLPQTDYRLEFYACDGAGAGEGETYLGSTTTTTDANGDADDTTTLPARVRVGEHVAMTATRTELPGSPSGLARVPHDTSELSPCEEVE